MVNRQKKADRFGGHMKCIKEHHVGSIHVDPTPREDGRYVVSCDYERTGWPEYSARHIYDVKPMTVERIFDLTGRNPTPKEPGHG